MSYSEENGQVVLRMSRGDWQIVLMMLRSCRGWKNADGLLDRIERGNPNYTPYQVEETKC
jgi:hypothetical protein